MASILKSEPAESQPVPKGLSGLAGFNLDDFAEAGIKQLKEIQGEAARILARAKEEAEVIRQQAHDTGLAEGRAAAASEAEKTIQAGVQQQLREQLPIYQELVDQLGVIQSEFLQQWSATLITTSLGIAERVVLAKCESDERVLVRWTEEAISMARTARQLVIAVHPETLVRHGEKLEQLFSAAGMPEDIRIESDENVEPVGVVVRVDGCGQIDMALSQQLSRLDSMLRGMEEIGDNQETGETEQ